MVQVFLGEFVSVRVDEKFWGVIMGGAREKIMKYDPKVYPARGIKSAIQPAGRKNKNDKKTG